MSALRPLLRTLLLVFGIFFACSVIAEEKVDFNYDIRPIISQKCFHCHGPDEGSRKAKLRLDLRDEAIKEREGVRAIVPGDLKESELVLRILSHDKDEVMPPPKEGEALTAKEIELLQKWIAQGAEYKQHWAWSKPERPVVPTADPAAGSVRNPIDSFILARLHAAGLKQSPEADRHTLIRRLALDLTGLPPSPEEVRAFVQDQSPDYYEKAVDRLLASPHFGEKWARMWMDIARYADSTGYGSDKFRMNIWPYRDWLINAFNRNLPYDQFSIEQLAGDLLPNATPEQIAATAFHRNTMTNVEGGTIDEEYRVAAVKDRIATTSQAWMGLTMQCAQCHSHKFDPITQKEYYQFFAIFNQTADSDREDEEPTMPLPTAAEREKTERLKGEIAALEAKFSAVTPEFEAELHEWEAQMVRPIEWKPLLADEAKSASGAPLEQTGDFSLLAKGTAAETDTYSVKVHTSLQGITAFRLELLPDPSLPQSGPGRAENGNLVLSELHVSAAPADAKARGGQFFRIELPGSERILSLAEVELFSGNTKVAAKGKARQSSTGFGGDAGRALDGNTNGDYQANSVTHTQQENNPWWEVDLGAEVSLDKVKLWSRTDGQLSSRLAPAKLILLNSKREPVWEQTITEAPVIAGEWKVDGSRTIKLQQASADYAQKDFTPEQSLDGQDKTGWAVGQELGKAHSAVFQAATPVTTPGGETILTFSLVQKFGQQHLLGRFRLSATTQSGPIRELPANIRTILAIEPSEREPAQREELLKYFRPLSKLTAGLQQQIAAKQKELAAIKPVSLPVLRELAADKRRTTHLLNKGNYLAPAEEVRPVLPAAFCTSSLSGHEVSRLEAAQWLVTPENPLTARVAVNRFWSQLFGTGIVATEEDFGTQGALPSHPELLDWLAVTFQSSVSSDTKNPGLQWDMKALLKLIVTSATYRQSSKVSAEALEGDARNRLLSHYPRRRLEAEAVRDQALALSGLLSRKIGGPSVYPPQPDGLWKVAFNGGQNAYPTSKGEDRYRRGVYTFWRRTMPYPSMSTFDAPSRESCTLRRLPTNTPLQAFVTLNDPCFVECAQALARRITREGGTDAAQRIRWALELALARPATDAQVVALQTLLESELAHYREDPDAARKLSTSATQPLPAGGDPAELAAWTVVANVLLNLDSVLMKS